MKKNLYALLLSIFFTILAVPATSYAMGTPDGETPAEESVCDELKGGTPGLYGLCVAYCEARDLNEAELERLMHARPKAANRILRRNAPKMKLIDIYESKRMEGDPSMPCLDDVEGDTCPCFDEDDLMAWKGAYSPAQEQIEYGDLEVQSSVWSANDQVFDQVLIGGTQCIITDIQQKVVNLPDQTFENYGEEGKDAASQREDCVNIFETVFPKPD